MNVGVLLLVLSIGDMRTEKVVNVFDTVRRCEAYRESEPELPPGYRFECKAEYLIKEGPDADEGR